LRRIIITGARGYIGCALARRLAVDRHALRLVSRTKDCGPIVPGLPGRIEHVAANLQEEKSWAHLIEDADAVVHLSARTDLRAAEADPAADESLNVEPVRGLIRAAARQRRSELVVVFASTVTIVGARNENPVDELTPDSPVSVYDRHKLLCEHLFADATERGLMRSCSLRLSNVYGFGSASKNANRGILNVMIERAVKSEPITIIGDGQYVRDFIHLDDVVDAFRSALACEQVHDGRHYVIASGKGRTLADAFAVVSREASRITGRPVDLRHVPEPEDLHVIERRNFVGNSDLFRTKTGWLAQFDFESGVRRALKEVLYKLPKTSAG
jgi:nucleoside-diphosphate-sugar epimerase